MISLKYKNVSFNYGDDHKIIKNLSLDLIGPGLILLEGKNGTGKTTFVNLVFNVWKSYMGNIYINDINIKDMTINEISDKVGICFQKTPIFYDTVIDNILLGSPIIDKEIIISLCKKFNLFQDNSIEAMQYILENGEGLSGGQEQKVGIIRLLLRNPMIMIFDEPTSNMDINSKMNLIHTLNDLRRKKLVIVISHDNDIKKISDKIINTNGWK